jgi:hypothetical protein
MMHSASRPTILGSSHEAHHVTAGTNRFVERRQTQFVGK